MSALCEPHPRQCECSHCLARHGPEPVDLREQLVKLTERAQAALVSGADPMQWAHAFLAELHALIRGEGR